MAKGRVRQPIPDKRLKLEWNSWTVRFVHPLEKRTVRCVLADKNQRTLAETNLKKLNEIFLDRKRWRSLPDGTPECIRKAWGDDTFTLRLGDKDVVMRSRPHVIEFAQEALGDEVFSELEAELAKPFQEDISDLRQRIRELEKEAAHWKGRRLQDGPPITLKEALEKWKESLPASLDPDYRKNTLWDVGMFIKHFKEETLLSEIEGREDEINKWLNGLRKKQQKPQGQQEQQQREQGQQQRQQKQKKQQQHDEQKQQQRHEAGQPIGASRRKDIRRAVLAFLTDSGAHINRKLVKSVKLHEIRKGRGPVRWLEYETALKVATKLEKYRKVRGANYKGVNATYWADLFRVQVGMGFRPDELITLKRADISRDWQRLTLSPLTFHVEEKDGTKRTVTLTLKRGSRTVKIPKEVRTILERRLDFSDVAFPDIRTGRPWENAKNFDGHYFDALEWARKAVKIPFKLDCRIGRRTCATILLSKGVPVKNVADIIGDSVQTLVEHYGAVIPDNLDPSLAALKNVV